MAGGKLSARQKMINMMYLVLTALLALNISKEVLHAFVVVNIGLMQQKENLVSKNSATIVEFQNQVTTNKGNERIKKINDDAVQVSTWSRELDEWIEDQKIKLVAYTDGVDEAKAKERVEDPFKVERKDDYDRPTKFFGTDKPPGTDGIAHDLKGKLEEFKNNLIAIVNKTPDKARINKTLEALGILNLEVPTDEEHAGSDGHSTWEMFYFYHQPQSAALVELTKWQNIVRGAESEVLTHLWNEISATAFKFDAVTAAIIPKSTFVTSGSAFEADVFLAAYSTAVKPTIIYGTAVDSVTGNVVGGQELPKDKIVDGKGRLEIPASGAGERTVGGVIKIMNPATGEETPYSFQTVYNVSPPAATVSPTKMNVVYRGLDNPIEVSVPGYAPNQVSVGCSGGSMSGGNGKFIVKPGSGRKLVISVSAKNADGKTTSMGSFEFRIKSVPTPTITWSGQRDGGRLGANAAGGSPLVPLMENFEFDVYAKITSFEINFNMNGALFSKRVTGNVLPGNIASKVRSLPSGTRVFFSSVKMTVPGGERRTASAAFTIQ